MIRLSPVIDQDWQKACRLTVADAQIRFVAYNSYSLAQACYEPNAIALAIYHHDDLVGFSLIQKKGRETLIVRLMIDCRHQRKGYGTAALREICEHFSGESLVTSYIPDNRAAAALYEGFGFSPTGSIVDGEVVMIRAPNQAR